MKKYPGVLKRVREIEAKRGISYIKPEDKLYKGIKIIYKKRIYDYSLNERNV